METLISNFIKSEQEKDMLTSFIENQKIALIHGESGSGKTVFAIKHLNESRIEPILVDFDDNTQAELQSLNLKAIIVDGESFMKTIFDLSEGQDLRDELSGSVLIIDTWTLFCKELELSEDEALNLLNSLTKANITVIIISHTTSFSGKEDKPDVSDYVYRHIKSRFYVRRTTLKSRLEYDLIIEKARGYKGSKIIPLRIEEREDEN